DRLAEVLGSRRIQLHGHAVTAAELIASGVDGLAHGEAQLAVGAELERPGPGWDVLPLDVAAEVAPLRPLDLADILGNALVFLRIAPLTEVNADEPEGGDQRHQTAGDDAWKQHGWLPAAGQFFGLIGIDGTGARLA